MAQGGSQSHHHEHYYQYLMWVKRKQMLKWSESDVNSTDGGGGGGRSWEERAFAEDAARILGGCIWPPRSYTCNFCHRHFRSAQALGGHMNIHRRDRARLKHQTLLTPKGPSSNSLQPHHQHHQVIINHYSHHSDNYVDTGLSMGSLPLPLPSTTETDHDQEGICCKRPKTSNTNISSLQHPPVFLNKPCSNQRTRFLGVQPKMEDLDLELRLGKPHN